MNKVRLWGLTGCPSVFTSEESASILAEFLHRTGSKVHGLKFKVYEIFPDCYAEKIKKGYTTFSLVMDRAGKVLKISKDVYVVPTRFGFNSGRIMKTSSLILHPTNPNKNREYEMFKAVHYTCLAKDEEEATHLCDKYRIKTLLDDIWFKKEGASFNNALWPGVAQKFSAFAAAGGAGGQGNTGVITTWVTTP
jgi:hypothetical protein